MGNLTGGFSHGGRAPTPHPPPPNPELSLNQNIFIFMQFLGKKWLAPPFGIGTLSPPPPNPGENLNYSWLVDFFTVKFIQW